MESPRPLKRGTGIVATSAFLVLVLAFVAMLASGTSPAWSFYSAAGAGTSEPVSLGTLQPPTNATVPSSSTGTVPVSWTAATLTPRPTGYYVTRTKTSDGTTSAACGTTRTSPIVGVSCNDILVSVGVYRYTVTSVYRSWTAPSTLSGSVNVTPAGSPSKLGFLVQPSSSSSAQAFAIQPQVAIQDFQGSIVTSGTPRLVTLSASGGTLSGCAASSPANSAMTVNGIATFSGCRITGPGSYTLTATVSSLTSAVTSSFTVAGPATKLTFTSSPSNSTGGIAFDTDPVVTVQDSAGRTATDATALVTLSISGNPLGAILSCDDNPITPSAGKAEFSECSVNKAGTYTLTAASTGLTSATSASFTILVGPASKLGFTSQPSPTSTGGVPFTAQPTVSIQDAGGNTVTTSTAVVNLFLTETKGASLACAATTRAASSGVASFTGCSIDKPNTSTLTATSAGLAFAFSTVVTNTVGPGAKLVFTTSPGNGARNAAFPVQPVVTVLDAGGNTVTASSAPITLTLTTPGTATLACTPNTTKGASSGIATFTGCQVNTNGTYSLTATSAGLTKALSSTFVMSTPPPRMIFSTQPSASVSADTAFPIQPVITILTANGATATGNTSTITLSLNDANGATLTCAANSRKPMNGLAAFSGCSIDKPGVYTLTAKSSNAKIVPINSATITVTGPAAKLAFTTMPTTGTAGTVFTTQPSVAIHDAAGNATPSTAPVSLTLTTPAGATLSCTANPKAAVAGTASFSGCSINTPGTYTITATSPALENAVSANLTITAGPAAKLVFTSVPTDGKGGAAFATQPAVAIQDAAGNTITTSTASVSLTLTTPAGAVLLCDKITQPAVAGISRFTGCRIDIPGTFTLTATSGSFASAVSGIIKITP
ncbi:hypothetical protein [Arthrobacter psychrochitiniphilus]|uniref:hypothetical protein n=1 Tax=Arthrobacter psychrochitiniphilus TaxID=291045 RepID=UPI003F7BB5A9